jgi:hypothetical protein
VSEAAEIDKAETAADLTRSAYVRAQALAAPKMKPSTARRTRAAQAVTVAPELLARLLLQLRKCGI